MDRCYDGMSQSRTRKTNSAGEPGRSRPLAKASGDAAKNSTRDGTKEPKEYPKSQQHHRNKTSIPKNIRYDLENALVGLCDVWFEDIKPYLLRNNIKLHVNCDGGAGAGEVAAGGDRGQLPPGAPSCSHIDPGAAADRQQRPIVSSAGFSSALPATSRTRVHRPPQPPSKLMSPLLSPAKIPENRNNSAKHLLASLQAGHLSAVHSSIKTSATTRPPRTYDVHNAKVPLKAPYAIKQSFLPCGTRQSLEVFLSQHIPKMKDKYTQTEAPRMRRISNKLPVQLPERDHAKLKFPANRQQSPSPVRRRQSPSPSGKQRSSSANWQNSSALMERNQSPTRKLQKSSSSSPPRRMGPRVLFTSPSVDRQKPREANKSVNSVSHGCIDYYRDDPQSQDELYHIVGATYDTDLMYENPKTEANSSTLNLNSSPPQKERVKINIKPPWR